MKSSAKKIELASVDDLFSTEEGRQDAKLEKIQEIPLSELHPFKNHPFKVKDDEAMMETADSIKQYGVLVPAIARPDPEGGYELVLKPQTPEMLLEEKQFQEQVYAAVMKLPEKQAKRIYARYYLGMAVNEIAEVEGVDPSRVRDSIRRGLKQLVKYF